MSTIKKLKAPNDKMIFWIVLIFFISIILMVLSVLTLSYAGIEYYLSNLIKTSQIIID